MSGLSTIRIASSGQTFQVSRSESILDGALAQGIQLPHQCRGASCGECKSKVLSGEVDHGWALGFAISDEEKEAGFCLACQAKPVSELVEIQPLKSLAEEDGPRLSRATVVAVTRLTPRVCRLVLALEGDVQFSYEAGSYAELVLPGVAPNRMYSFASPMGRSGLLEFFVARHPGGKGSGYIHDKLQVGDLVEVRGPFGSCRLPPAPGTVLGLAGGTGLAPVLAIIEDSLAKGAGEPHRLVLSVREDAEVFALDRLQGLSRQYLNFKYHLVVTDQPSRHCAKQQFAPEWLRETFPTLAGTRIVIGGSPSFVDACASACVSLGVASHQVSTDSFTPVVNLGLSAVNPGDK